MLPLSSKEGCWGAQGLERGKGPLQGLGPVRHRAQSQGAGKAETSHPIVDTEE